MPIRLLANCSFRQLADFVGKKVLQCRIYRWQNSHLAKLQRLFLVTQYLTNFRCALYFMRIFIISLKKERANNPRIMIRRV